jgi:hypothetical protein
MSSILDLQQNSIINAILTVFEPDDRFYINSLTRQLNLIINNVNQRKLKRLIFSMFNSRGLFYDMNPPEPTRRLTIIEYHMVLILENNDVLVFDMVLQDLIMILYFSYQIAYSDESEHYQRELQSFLMGRINNEWYSTNKIDKDTILFYKIKKITFSFKFRENFDHLLMQTNILQDLRSFLGFYQTHVTWNQIENFFDMYLEDDYEARVNLINDLDINSADPIIFNEDLDDDLIVDPYEYLNNFNFDEFENNFYRYENNNNRFIPSLFDSEFFINEDDNAINNRDNFIGNAIKNDFIENFSFSNYRR